MKYIIDIPDEAIDFMGGRDHLSMLVEPECKVGDCKHYALRISKEDITPYTEPDKEPIENEAWDFVTALYGLSDEELYEIFPNGCPYEMTYSEAKAKYEAWEKQKDEIRVGDEVEQIILNNSLPGQKCVVLKIDGDTMKGIGKNGNIVLCSYQVKRWWAKTGRHFDEVEELLKKIGE